MAEIGLGLKFSVVIIKIYGHKYHDLTQALPNSKYHFFYYRI